MLGIGLGINSLSTTITPPTFAPPEGFAFVVTDDGEYVLDGDGNYVVTETE